MFQRAAGPVFRLRRGPLLGLLTVGLLICARPVTAQAFAPKADITVGPFPGTVSAVRVRDGVGPLDLVITTQSGVSVLLGSGTGTFTPTGASPIAAGTFPQAAAVGNINTTTDSHMDIAVANFTSGDVSILLGDGNGGFSAATNFSTGPAGNHPFSVAIANLNTQADNFPDLVVSNEATNTVSVLTGNGQGGFSAPVTYPVGPDPHGLAVADLNGDGILDVVVTNYNLGQPIGPAANNVSVLIGNGSGGKGDGTFKPAVNYKTRDGARAVAIADLGNGKLDLVVGAASGYVSVLLGNGDGTFQAVSTDYLVDSKVSPFGVAVGDFNLDGKPDVAVVNFDAFPPQTPPLVYQIAVLNGDGAGGLGAPGTFFAVGNQPDYVGVGDFNGDGKLDLAVSNQGGGTVSILLNNLPPAFADLAIAKTGPASVTAGTNVVYTVTVTNNGPAGPTTVTVADPTPTGLTFVSNTGACTTAYPCTALGPMPSGQVKTITSTYTVAAGYTGANPILNTATVSSTGTTDSVPGNNSATSSTPVAFSADLAITKTGPASVTAGQNVVYTITVTNNGPSAATAVSVADPTPAGLTFVSNAGACTGAFPCNTLGPIGVGQVKTITSTYTVPAGYTGANPILNTATVGSSSSTDPSPGNNSATSSTPAILAADLAITKTGPANVVVGQNVVYTITVTNNGPNPAAAVSVADTTPAGLTFVSNTGACTTAFPCTALGPLAVGQVKTITSTYAVPTGYTTPIPILNSATVSSSTTTDPTSGNNSATASTTVSFAADLAVSKTGPGSVDAGQNVVYAITVTNNGPNNATVVSVADVTPAGLLFVSNTGACSTAFPCNALGPMTSGQVKTITSTYTVPLGYAGANPILNTATVTATTPNTIDPNTGNNTSTTSTGLGAALADLAISKSGPDSVFRGASVVYTITVTNNGPTDAVGVSVADPTPTGLTFVSNAGACTTAFPCAVGSVQAGSARSITATFAVPAGYAGPDPVVNSASVTSTTPDPSPANNAASFTSRLDPMHFYTLSPCRVFDTRDATGAPSLAHGDTRPFTVTGAACGVPSTARAVSVTLTVTNPTAPGDLRVYPAGGAQSTTSAINYGIGQTRANNAVMPLGTGGAIDVFCEQGAGTADFILDVNGYFAP